MIKEIVNEINRLLYDGYPYSALGIALTIPDICGNIEYPDTSSCGERYRKWFNQFVLPQWKVPDNSNQAQVTGAICYQLRCAYLHSGNFDLRKAEGVKNIRQFNIYYNRNPEFRIVHATIFHDGTYNLDMDLGVLCSNLCNAAKSYYECNQEKCDLKTVIIKDITPTEEDQKRLIKKFEKETGYTLEQLKELKRKNPSLIFDL